MTALGETAWYVYAVLPDGMQAPCGGEAILPGAALDLISQNAGAGALAALVSLVPKGLFAPDDAACRAAEPDWVAARAAAHHAVVAEVSAAGQCLPLGFGTLFASSSGVRNWLDAHAECLRGALRQLGERQEWAISLIEDEAAHTAWLQANCAGLLRLAEDVQHAGPGAGFLLKRRKEKALAGERDAHAASAAGQLHARLAGAFETRREAEADEVAACWSVLSERGDALPGLLETLRNDLARTGLALRVTGPWPPYAFARAFWQESEHD